MAQRIDDTWRSQLDGETIGDYRLIEFVGKGKIGYVYRAEKRGLPGLDWAVKIMFNQPKDGWENEVHKVMKLQQVPGVVHFHNLGAEMIVHAGKSIASHFTVWDYIPPGENLKDCLNRKGEVGTSFLLAVVQCILHVLHACKDMGISRHGDLHSGNILIGNASNATLDYSMQKREPIFVSDFGYGSFGAMKKPKDDYDGLKTIINEVISKVNYSAATGTDRQVLKMMQSEMGKLLNETQLSERREPLELIRVLNSIKKLDQYDPKILVPVNTGEADQESHLKREPSSVGRYQVSEMIGDHWEWWQLLFVPSVPARSKILDLNIPTVVTGPRGCGKTMLLRRLSERLIIECGEVPEISNRAQFIALYVNANDFTDAFSHFPEKPTDYDEGKLTCYAHLCILADFLAVLSARIRHFDDRASTELLSIVRDWLMPKENLAIIEGEDPLENCRAVLEQIKWRFPNEIDENIFPGYNDLSQFRWLPNFIRQARKYCPWIGKRTVLLFIDDFSLPRISPSMQRVLNRLFFQRSPEFLAKIATEASSTFVPEDSSRKSLQDGDDYQLVDMGEESLFLDDSERLTFLNEVFSRRLNLDPRVPDNQSSLKELLGLMPFSKTEFARRLRGLPQTQSPDSRPDVDGSSQRRGRTRPRVLYFGENVFSDLWSGDTRMMIQLITDIVDSTSGVTHPTSRVNQISLPVKPDIQDRVFSNRGGLWLDSHARNEPTDQSRMKAELKQLQNIKPGYELCGLYGDHLKAVVEAFVSLARHLLLGPTYIMDNGRTRREVPRMAGKVPLSVEIEQCLTPL